MTSPSHPKRLPPIVLGWLLSCAVIAAWPIDQVTLPMRVASCAYFAMLSGLILRRQRVWHLRLMNLAIGMDLALVLTLQFQRSAVQTALAFKLSAWQQAHIAFSTGATLLYFPVAILGWRIARSSKQNSTHPSRLRALHRGFAIPAFIFRTLGYLLMFSMLGSSSR